MGMGFCKVIKEVLLRDQIRFLELKLNKSAGKFSISVDVVRGVVV